VPADGAGKLEVMMLQFAGYGTCCLHRSQSFSAKWSYQTFNPDFSVHITEIMR